MLIKTDLKPKASVRAFIKTYKSIYVVVRLMLIAQLPDNTNHQHPFILGGWWTFDDIIDQYTLHMLKLQPLVKRVLDGSVAKDCIRHVNGYFLV